MLVLVNWTLATVLSVNGFNFLEMRKQLAYSYRLHRVRRTSIPPHMQVLSCHLACQDLRYCCNLQAIDRLSVLTPEGRPMKFLCPLRKSVHLVALLHPLHSGEGHHRPLS